MNWAYSNDFYIQLHYNVLSYIYIIAKVHLQVSIIICSCVSATRRRESGIAVVEKSSLLGWKGILFCCPLAFAWGAYMHARAIIYFTSAFMKCCTLHIILFFSASLLTYSVTSQRRRTETHLQHYTYVLEEKLFILAAHRNVFRAKAPPSHKEVHETFSMGIRLFSICNSRENFSSRRHCAASVLERESSMVQFRFVVWLRICWSGNNNNYCHIPQVFLDLHSSIIELELCTPEWKFY